MHLPHHYDDATARTLAAPLTRAQLRHRASKSLAAGREFLRRADPRLLPPDLLSTPASRSTAQRLTGWLRWLRSYYGMIVEKLSGYEFGDPEYDDLRREKRTLETVRDALVRAELIPAAWLLAEAEEAPTPAPADICHGREVRA